VTSVQSHGKKLNSKQAPSKEKKAQIRLATRIPGTERARNATNENGNLLMIASSCGDGVIPLNVK
jgi:hypothetical protein